MKTIEWKLLSNSDKEKIINRNQCAQRDDILEKTQQIIEAVKQEGDAALLRLTEKFDQVVLQELKVSETEFKLAQTKVDSAELKAIKVAIERIKAYNIRQLPEAYVYEEEGIRCERQARPIQSVGLYVPGGTAPLISTVMMLAIPALVAGCKRRILCTPPDLNGNISPVLLIAAKICGIDEIFKVGGAQAIAAMAYGTMTVPKVDKIFGPGNAWVTQAKILCAIQAQVSIDLPAGPSELFVIADKSANPVFVAADLLSQAEHDILSQVVLATPDKLLAETVLKEIKIQLEKLPRKNIAEKSIENSLIIIVDDIKEAIEISNGYAPEHLSLQLKNTFDYQSMIESAGTVFLGNNTAESMGDYITGANHVLPTSGYARSQSGLSVLDFMKWVGFQEVSDAGLKKLGPIAQQLAEMEGLNGHKNAISYRLSEFENV
ncbi:histidinol dehydrogenase [Candidatus Berkiella cookevillensis]|uniref:Histidinol dehydrogenase n=1 Tax=Candidatus Berkiella cookevillensis TaxID=437022 RepID=A0A0Q9YF79_9GAMM|nr:histidinol dehydrogenase [Candidatus Berkiella cookevillensis]MCS5708108.1 histidinol dehydrogenase [Candidatus Berkiella cookevillensis]